LALYTAFASLIFFVTDTAPTEISTLSLHDALPISAHRRSGRVSGFTELSWEPMRRSMPADVLPRFARSCSIRFLDLRMIWCARRDRKSTRLNSSHLGISYAVFCLKKKKNTHTTSNK